MRKIFSLDRFKPGPILLACLLVVACGCGTTPEPPETASETTQLRFPGAPVILVSIDTLRSDHLPAYGYTGVETPAIDALRSDGILFERAYSNSPLTLPSHVSLLTGTLPAVNGVRNNAGYHFDAAAHASLPTLLSDAGYATGAAVSAYVLRAGTGLGAAFDFYDDAMSVQGLAATGSVQRGGTHTLAAARQWVRAHAHEPFFLFLHLFEPHSPYEPPEPFRSRYQLAYDGEIAAADAVVGELLADLRGKGLYDRALIVLLADHGEGLDDHGEAEHGILLYREAIQVPLILKLPGSRRAGKTIHAPVQLVDVLPTVAELVGVPVPQGIAGVPQLTAGADAAGGHTQFAETMYPRIHFGWSELRSIIQGRYHLVAGPTPELFDLENDPAEEHDLHAAQPDVARRLSTALEPLVAELQAPAAVSGHEAEALRALGYLADAGTAQQGPLPDPRQRLGELRDFNQALGLAAAQDHEGAITLLRSVLERNPGLTDGWLRLAAECQRAGRPADAVAAYERAFQVSPRLGGDTAASLASLLITLNRLDEAREWALRAVGAGAASGHLLLGRIALARGDQAEAEARARRAMADSLLRVNASVLLAESLVAQGEDRLLEALDAVEAARDECLERGLDPVSRLELVRGDVLARLGRRDEAEAAFLAEIEHFPRTPPAYTNLAVVYYMDQDVARARATLQSMVRANPYPISLMLAARTCEQMGDTEAANAWQQQLAAARPRARKQAD